MPALTIVATVSREWTSIVVKAPRDLRCSFVSSPRTRYTIASSWADSCLPYSSTAFAPPALIARVTSWVQKICVTDRTTIPGQRSANSSRAPGLRVFASATFLA